jgi:hypothetical protein
MRFNFVLLSLVAALPLAAQRNDPLAFMHQGLETTDVALIAYRDQSYVPVRPGEVRSASFLTELRVMPFGRVLGPVTQPMVAATQSAETILPGAQIAVQPPEGATYQRGDTVVLALRLPGPRGWGDIILPTGLARIGDRSPRQTQATVIAMYGAILGGQVVLPLEPVASVGNVKPQAIVGPTGEIVIGDQPHELQQPGVRMFVTMGRSAGIRIGDFIQVRRRPEARQNESDTVDDLMAVGQVVHVGEQTSTIRLVRVIDADIRPGTPVVRVATLPN